MTITYEAFKKRFGQEFTLRLTNGVIYNAWSVAKPVYKSVIPNTPIGKISHYLDGSTLMTITIKRGEQITLFMNQKGEHLALVSL